MLFRLLMLGMLLVSCRRVESFEECEPETEIDAIADCCAAYGRTECRTDGEITLSLTESDHGDSTCLFAYCVEYCDRCADLAEEPRSGNRNELQCGGCTEERQEFYQEQLDDRLNNANITVGR